MSSSRKEQVQRQFPIRIRAGSERRAWSGLTPILEELLPVKFLCAQAGAGECRGEVVMEHVQEGMQDGDRTKFSCPEYSSTRGDAEKEGLVEDQVGFADDPHVPFPFRGRTLKVSSPAEFGVLSPGGNERVLARTTRGPVWTMSESGGVRKYRSGFALPGVSPESALKDVFNETRFLEVLPLVHWLREIAASTAYQGPSPRACFVFDDPNLHWPSYGFIDFRELARQAAKESYHVSFGTIPLDGWFTHPVAATVLRSNRKFLSLAVHGNNHTRQELARRYSEAESVALLRQAIYRIEQIERKTGFPICRVMVPPHGACSEEMLELLPMCGFEAACLSHGSLRAHNREKPWTRSLGYSPSELVQGCPVLPRWGFSGNTENAVLLAVYLRQPVILRGHHQDLKNGVEMLAHLAGFINGLGPVRWSNLTDLSRSNYESRMEGATCHLRPLGHRIDFQVPDGATGFVIDDWNNGALASWNVSGLGENPLTTQLEQEISIPSGFTGLLSLSASLPARDLPQGKKAKRFPAAACVRRVLTETRDRLAFSN